MTEPPSSSSPSSKQKITSPRETKQGPPQLQTIARGASGSSSTGNSGIETIEPLSNDVESELAVNDEPVAETKTNADADDDKNVYAQPLSDEASLAGPVYEVLLAIKEPVVDQEHGMLAMFNELNQQLPGLDTEQAQAAIRSVLAQLFAVYATTVKKVNDDPVMGQVARDLTTTDEEFGLSAMFAELRQQFPDLQQTDAATYMNAMLAQLLQTYLKATAAAGATLKPMAQTVVDDVSTVDEEFGMHAMFKEVAEQFPEVSAREAQEYMLSRYRDISSEAKDRKAEI
jgi:hypothetical protein